MSGEGGRKGMEGCVRGEVKGRERWGGGGGLLSNEPLAKPTADLYKGEQSGAPVCRTCHDLSPLLAKGK